MTAGSSPLGDRGQIGACALYQRLRQASPGLAKSLDARSAVGGPAAVLSDYDALALTAIFGVVFALSIDYQVFILSRVREEWLRCGDEQRALDVRLTRTARVVTGAALSMLGVFVACGLGDVASLGQFGVGLAIAVIIDATLVRLVMLPAALLVAGEWTWLAPHLHHDEDPQRAHVIRAPHVTPAPDFD